MNLLVTGVAGFLGSITANLLCSNGHRVIGIDNFINSDDAFIKYLQNSYPKNFIFHQVSLSETDKLFEIQTSNNVSNVIHFAGLKSIEESNLAPEKYFKNNVLGTQSLLDSMILANTQNIIFSSSATVYGIPSLLPITESHKTSYLNPYGQSKIDAEKLLETYAIKNDLKVIALRYFNPIGSCQDNILGDFGGKNPSNIFPLLCKAAESNDRVFKIYGDNYETNDGTGERDYIHAVDLALGHISAIQYFKNEFNYEIFNIGTGVPTSVYKLISIFENVSGIKLKIEISAPRDGDVAICYADPKKANSLLNWYPAYSIERAVSDGWNFHKSSI